MPYYRQVGEVPRKRHTLFRQPDGSLYHEELMGADGFSAESALLYHRHSPSAILDVQHADHDDDFRPNVPLLPRHLRTPDVARHGDLVEDRVALLGNDDLTIAWAEAVDPSPLYRNATGDELVFVQAGSGRFESVFGTIRVRSGDYVVVPTGTTHRWVPDELLACLVVMARGHVRPPKRYLSPAGQLVEQSIYCERDLRVPEGPLLVEDDGGDDGVLVFVRHGSHLTGHVHARHPFDVVGWDGCLYPWALSIHDIEPIVGRLHQPPPVHQTFEAPGFVVCSFVPRPYDFHPEAVRVPYHHANVDSDEVLFYSSGDFMSRAGSGVDVGSITLHPAGHVHGPQPGSVERSMAVDHTDEVAVMIDAFSPLRLSAAGRAVEDRGYAYSWARTASTSSP
jgi:homogentisate 1,2-dioxygenase